jgi:methionyl-tRNA formyltransferase
VKVVFCGTPEIAVPALEALAEIAEIPGVVCQPDRPSGRGLKMSPPAVKVRALQMGLEVHQPTKMRDGSFARWIREKEADAAVVIAYGRILTADSLQAPRLGCINLHASLLPEYRGAAPIQRALMDGRKETGVCLMQMDVGMDTGPVLAEHRIAIVREDNAETLALKLGRLAAEVIRLELPRFFRGELQPRAQDHTLSSHAPPITREDSPLNWMRSAAELIHQVQGLSPRPGATAKINKSDGSSRVLKVISAQSSQLPLQLRPGEVGAEQGHLLVGTGDGLFEILQAQLEGKKTASGRDLLNGRALQPGDILT